MPRRDPSTYRRPKPVDDAELERREPADSGPIRERPPIDYRPIIVVIGLVIFGLAAIAFIPHAAQSRLSGLQSGHESPAPPQAHARKDVHSQGRSGWFLANQAELSQRP
jgi:hypothetical protein